MKFLLAAISTAFISTSAFAIDLTFTSFEFSTADTEDGEVSKVELGTRVGLSRVGNGQIMIEGLSSTETTDRKFGDTEEESTLILGGGYLRYFDGLGDSVEPYVGIGGYYVSQENEVSSDQSKKTTGIYYKGLLGLKVNMSKRMFFVLESILFFNPLNSSTTDTGNNTSTNETTLGISSSSKLSDVQIGLGISF